MKTTERHLPGTPPSHDAMLRKRKSCGGERAIYTFCAVILLILTLSFAQAQDGSYDPSFGSNGRTWINVSASIYDQAAVMRVLANGTLFTAGNCGKTAPQICATWLDASGAYAPGYGTAGSGRANFDDFYEWLPVSSSTMDAVVLPDQRVVILCSLNTLNYGIAVLKSDGSGLDLSVGNLGLVTISSGSFSLIPSKMALQKDGRIVIAGTARTNVTPFTYSLLAMRLLPNFTPDPSFGSNGAATVQFPPISPGDDPGASSVALQTDGKILLGGSTDIYSPSGDLAVVRLNPNGTLDTTFGAAHDGRYRLQLGSAGSRATAIAQGAHGRIAIGGYVGDSTSSKWLVGRLLPTGIADATFNFGQPQMFPIGTSSTFGDSRVLSVIEQSDGKLIAGGTVPHSMNPYLDYFGVARFTTDGIFDPSFGAGGFSYGGLSNQADSINDVPSVFALTNGGLMIAGTSTKSGGETHFAIAKLRIDLIFTDSFE